jgi:hypothetical protein
VQARGEWGTCGGASESGLMIRDLAAWRAELMRTGRIVQDDDEGADRDQAQRDCLRYVELVEMVDGSEGRNVFDALLASMQVPEDYGVYEATVRVLHRFPDASVGEWIHESCFGLLERSAFRAWDLLNQLARERFGVEAREQFDRAWGRADPQKQQRLLVLVEQQERDGWLDDPAASGKLRPVTTSQAGTS